MEAIATGDRSSLEIARQAGMSILELAEHVCTPRNLEALARVTQLHEIEREMMLGRLKRKALGRLAELTDEVAASSADEIRASEVMRKACVDLLRYGGGTTSSTARLRLQSSPPGPEPLTPAFEAEILEALEKLGEEKYEYEPRTRVSGSVAPPLSKASPESHLYMDSISRNGPGADASGSLSKCTRSRRVPPLEIINTRTGAPGTPAVPGIPGPPAPPRDVSIGHGQSRHYPGCRGGKHEDQAVPGARHGIVGVDHAHPP